MLVDTPIGSYMLGVIHGDGHVSQRSVSITVDRKTPEYSEKLKSAWIELGYSPKSYLDSSGNSKIEVHSIALATELRKFKKVDRWMFPHMPSDCCQYLAGLIDTDGWVSKPESKHNRINITQKSGDKLPNIRCVLDEIGFNHIDIITRNNNMIRGKPYPIDVIWWTNQDDVLLFAKTIPLKHEYKARRLEQCVEGINRIRSENKSYHVLRILRINNGATIPMICSETGFSRYDVLHILNALRRQSRVTRNDPDIDSLTWNWVDTNRGDK